MWLHLAPSSASGLLSTRLTSWAASKGYQCPIKGRWRTLTFPILGIRVGSFTPHSLEGVRITTHTCDKTLDLTVQRLFRYCCDSVDELRRLAVATPAVGGLLGFGAPVAHFPGPSVVTQAMPQVEMSHEERAGQFFNVSKN